MSKPKVPAADQTLRILSLLASARGPLQASMIASQLELPRSTVYQLLDTLKAHGFVMHIPGEQRYGLGIAAVELSGAYARQAPLARLGRPIVAGLVQRLGVSGHLAVPHGGDVLYVVEERAPGTMSLVTDVDVRLPMPITATGRAILSAMPKAQVRALFPDRGSFVYRHAETDDIDRYSKLRSELDRTVTRGYALERGSVTHGLASVAQPVLDHRDWPVAAVAVTFDETRVEESAFEDLASEVRVAAATLAERIHGRHP